MKLLSNRFVEIWIRWTWFIGFGFQVHRATEKSPFTLEIYVLCVRFEIVR